MAKADLFHDSTKSVPRGDARVVRVDFDHEEIGARRSHIKGISPKNSYSIRHVTEK